MNWINYGHDFRKFRDAGLAKPGVQVEINGDLYLIGDINDMRGVCDDCSAFHDDAVVTCYRVVVAPQDLAAR